MTERYLVVGVGVILALFVAYYAVTAISATFAKATAAFEQVPA